MLALQDHSTDKKGAKGSSKAPAARPAAQAAPEVNPFWQSLAMRPAAIQTKLIVSQPNDPDEREADRVAAQAIRTAIPPSLNSKPSCSALTSLKAQRKCAPCEEEETLQRKKGAVQSLWIQKKPLEVSSPGNADEKEADEVARKIVDGQSAEIHGTGGTVSRKEGGSAETTPEFQSKLESSKGTGQSLDDSTRGEMESKIGADFSAVKVHMGSGAHKMSEGINAKAFTHGQEVFFKQGEFNANSQQGKELLAHELTHTVQQKGDIQRKIQRQHGDEGRDTPPFENKTLQQELEDLEKGKYDDDPQAQYRAARKVLIASYANQIKLSPADEQSLIVIIAKEKETPNQQQKVNNQNATPSQQNAPEEYPDSSPDPDVQKMLEEKLEKIKCGEYANNPQAEYDTARELLTSNLMQHFSLSPEDRQLLVGMVAGKSPMSGQTVANQNVAIGSSCYARKTEYTDEDVKNAAWDIVQHEQSVKDAFLFFSQIKTNVDKSKWEEELAKFFTGEYEPRARIRHIKTSGRTGVQPGPRKHKKIKLSTGNSFSLAVSTYLHEMTHYADIWYSSMAAIIKGEYRPKAEFGAGIRPGKSDLPKQEQVNAMGESVTATIEQILIDMQHPTLQPNEHHRVPDLRGRYKQAKSEVGFQNDVYVNKIREELRSAAIGMYEAWGAEANAAGKITGTGLELGFAFEKAAYGFYNPQQKKGEWAVGFNDKFEKKYCKYLQ